MFGFFFFSQSFPSVFSRLSLPVTRLNSPVFLWGLLWCYSLSLSFPPGLPINFIYTGQRLKCVSLLEIWFIQSLYNIVSCLAFRPKLPFLDFLFKTSEEEILFFGKALTASIRIFGQQQLSWVVFLLPETRCLYKDYSAQSFLSLSLLAVWSQTLFSVAYAKIHGNR